MILILVELEIPKDHIHMVVHGVPKISPSGVEQVIKRISAREFFRRNPDIKKRYFFGVVNYEIKITLLKR